MEGNTSRVCGGIDCIISVSVTSDTMAKNFPLHRSQFQAGPNAGNATTETLPWKWSTHAFFVEAFGLRPIVETDENSETIFGPAAATQERVKAVWSAVINSRDQIVQELEALQGFAALSSN
jgi:hypothetical protein